MRSLFAPTWQPSPSRLALRPGDLHIWKSSLVLTSPQRDRHWHLLSAEEQSRVGQYRFPQHRQRALAARGHLRRILGYCLQQDPTQLQFVYATHGKPALVLGPGEPTVEFNLSHAQDVMLCAVMLHHPVGIDLEQIRPLAALPNLTQRFFAPSEHRTIQALPPAQQAEAFFQYWTAKEALLKAIAQGLGGLERVELNLDQDPPQILRAPEVACGWGLRLFVPECGFVGAIATTVPQVQPYFWQGIDY